MTDDITLSKSQGWESAPKDHTGGWHSKQGRKHIDIIASYSNILKAIKLGTTCMLWRSLGTSCNVSDKGTLAVSIQGEQKK